MRSPEAAPACGQTSLRGTSCDLKCEVGDRGQPAAGAEDAAGFELAPPESDDDPDDDESDDDDEESDDEDEESDDAAGALALELERESVA